MHYLQMLSVDKQIPAVEIALNTLEYELFSVLLSHDKDNFRKILFSYYINNLFYTMKYIIKRI